MDASRVVSGYKKATEAGFTGTLNKVLGTLVSIEGTIRGADKVLLGSKTVNGRILQTSLVKTLQGLDSLFAELDSLRWTLKTGILGADKMLARRLETLVDALDVPRGATVGYAISDVEFTPTSDGDDEITYDLNRLKMWSTHLKKWCNSAQASIASAMKTVKKRSL